MTTNQHKIICNELNRIYQLKNKDYGNSFSKQFEEYGLVSSAIRLDDKINRLKNLINNEQQVSDESIEDTLLDMANYAIMTVMELRGEPQEIDYILDSYRPEVSE